AVASEERVAVEAILGTSPRRPKPSAIILILDATNLTRNLYLASQVLELGVPTVVALNMCDLARKAKTSIDTDALSSHLGCEVVSISARSGEGLGELIEACNETARSRVSPTPPKLLENQVTVSHSLRYDWAEIVSESCVEQAELPHSRRTEKVDAFLTHPVAGIAVFGTVLFCVFYLIFSFAAIPMDFIDGLLGSLGAWIAASLPDGQFESLVVDGIIAGVGGVLIFLPQICILFFCISLLEDTGYLARAACVMDRVLRKVGLPGKAFVPLLSAHACAIPAIMSARAIEDKNDRLTTILILPLMTCSARLPVYAMIIALLFPTDPAKGALVFTSCYMLGILCAMGAAFVFRNALFKGATSPLIIELPNYKVPSFKTAFLAAYDRGRTFARKAGTVILAISIILWFLMTYPQLPEDSDPATATLSQAAADSVELLDGAPLEDEARAAQEALEYSFAGRAGHLIEPALEPLGFDWKIGVGVFASFAAREVVVSALSVIYGVGEDGADGGSVLLDRLSAATHPDGTPVFDFATSVSLLVFFVLAMQCLPTQAVTRRETGSWKWAVFQLGYMTCLAYTASLITYQTISHFNLG
ncbi:MAG: ferrous iron transporter B, partial [Candidatus Hydrogenedentes bacterium]|nr:ferrous iron transporter B [Candidatus Hydrogenedentota bacterium]